MKLFDFQLREKRKKSVTETEKKETTGEKPTQTNEQ